MEHFSSSLYFLFLYLSHYFCLPISVQFQKLHILEALDPLSFLDIEILSIFV